MKNYLILLCPTLFVLFSTMECREERNYINFTSSDSERTLELQFELTANVGDFQPIHASRKLRKKLTQAPMNRMKTYEVPNCMYGSRIEGLCEQDAEYGPEVGEMFEKIITKMDPMVLNATMSHMAKNEPISYTSTSSLCPSINTVIEPKRGQNDKGEYVYILNQNEMIQQVEVETCIYAASSSQSRYKTRTRCENLKLPGEVTSCKQKYSYRRLINLSASGQEMELGRIRIPACCYCELNSSVTQRSPKK